MIRNKTLTWETVGPTGRRGHAGHAETKEVIVRSAFCFPCPAELKLMIILGLYAQCKLYPRESGTSGTWRGAVHIATFYPAAIRSRNRTLPRLKVMPEGQRYFDHVLMSNLIVERLKLRQEYTIDGGSAFRL